MNRTRGFILGIAAILFAATFSTGALAHTDAGATTGFAYGFGHPIGGLDHVLAIVAVGLFAYLLKGNALWLVPAAFVGMMAVGGIIGVFGIPVPMVELGIALSVVVIGGLIAFGKSIPIAAAMAVVGMFAIFHGHAHGAEMPETTSGLVYGLGFMLATALLHGVGILAGFGIGKLSETHGMKLARAS
ncbi:MAG: HupE/UreJ family protein, partial [Rhodospirillaceae bacterium]|nr:HupE/UreJ family protein [Rhodospirillaceae bacterium]